MNTNDFSLRHVGISELEATQMLQKIGVKSIDELIAGTLPANIRLPHALDLPEAMTEREFAEHIADLASKNEVFTSYIGRGWYDCVTPPVVLRNVLENPVWYTSYTPYQAEISQGRLEALFNFQSVITDLTGLPLSNCSLLDEATAGAEAALLLYNERSKPKAKAKANVLFVDEQVFESTRNVIFTRAIPQGLEVVVGDYRTFEFTEAVFGAIVQFPNAEGEVCDYADFVARATAADAKVAVAADLLSLVLLTPPGEWGADVVFGSAQRFGVPMYFGGPSAGYIACRMEYKRTLPGRIIGMSKDRMGKDAYRLALQTREQHIKREKATSNICTAQALLATMSSFYAVYHGPEGLKHIARRVHSFASYIAARLKDLGYVVRHSNYFDTLFVELPEGVSVEKVRSIAEECRVNFYYPHTGGVMLSLDETTLPSDLGVLCYILGEAIGKESNYDGEYSEHSIAVDRKFLRSSQFLTYEVFNKYHTETEMMRYIKRLERKDISLIHSMISLGSCTMKLNAASEVLPLSNPAFCNVHPYAPADQVEGTMEMLENLKGLLGIITGLPAVSLQPNSGAAGEYAGLRAIRSYHEANGQGHRNKVLLPASAHGTNPASASQCGYECVVVASDERGNVDWEDFMKKSEEHRDHLAAMMITYPSTHGIFETNIIDLCKRIHDCGAMVYMDGANMNAQVGLTNPGFIGADVCHLNLHKTFAIPHGGGGPGSGPICATRALEPYLPTHSQWQEIGVHDNVVAASPYGSAGVDVVSYAYIRLLGTSGLEKATRTAILSANYMATCLKDTYGIVYTGATGRVGHELILDCRKLRETTGVDESDIAKRLMDYGYHAPTLSFPVHGTLMIEPTESESKQEIDRFLEVMLKIWEEIQEVKEGKVDAEDNVLKNAPHPEYEVVADEWTHSYSRSKAAYPLPYLKDNKFWINVARIDNGFGDRNLIPAFCCCIAPSAE
ncbi:aminomethyl-transferring glycine dehydrogenase [Porphyromonas sp. COT-290 OH860]|uniref:aminomethyl-transferring glycine dehydrogenase n=1 Tax=Porphyromonas sp. COT-290 OH860 TaxID=1515615 RepID=UPI00052D49CB|nr:aminomethyl-transferring glycine dehydrogenase [Porphyromonas sp. COT-290 OH860]KGN83902.1 glycine dehydrogenase [Porphyromonas sp. COT-290 OH860]